jgi:hypothetical protein
MHHGRVTAVKGLEFISDRLSYIVLRGRWCNIIVLKVHEPSEKIVMIQKTVFKRN